jgi:hypothetical protein
MLSEVVVGIHTINLTKFGYGNETRNVSVSVGETYTLPVTLIGYGSLRICSYPHRAKVYIDGNYTGETPFENDKVVVGSYHYRLTKSYIYEDAENVVDVSAGKLTKVDVSLSHKVWLSLVPELLLVLVAVLGTFWAILEYIIPRLLKGKKLFIGSDPSYRQHLKEGDVDEKLKELFAKKKEYLSHEAKVSKKGEKDWEIIDGKTLYSIEDTGLNIYKKKNK